MPLYEYECECGNNFEEFHSVDERNKVYCRCGRYAKLIITNVFRPYIMQPYFDTGLGCVVESYSDRKRKMKMAGVEEAGDIKHFDDVRVSKPKANLGNMAEFGEVWRDVTQS